MLQNEKIASKVIRIIKEEILHFACMLTPDALGVLHFKKDLPGNFTSIGFTFLPNIGLWEGKFMGPIDTKVVSCFWPGSFAGRTLGSTI